MKATRPILSSSEHPRLSAARPTNTVHHSFSTQCYVQRVTNILSNMDMVAPERVHLELIRPLSTLNRCFLRRHCFIPTVSTLTPSSTNSFGYALVQLWLCRLSTVTGLVPTFQTVTLQQSSARKPCKHHKRNFATDP